MHNVMPQQLTLEPASVVRIRDGRGLVVSTAEGAIWLTQEDDIRDSVLYAGDAFRIERDGLTLLHAVERSRIIVGVNAAWPAELGVPAQRVRDYSAGAVPAAEGVI